MLINVRVNTELFQYNSFILLFKYTNGSVVFFCLYTNVIAVLRYDVIQLLSILNISVKTEVYKKNIVFLNQN